MPILIAMVLIMIWAQILTWLYATINPFTEQLWSIQRYNIAYYGAIWWIERSYLSLRWHEAWFEWEGWFIDWATTWHSSDYNFQWKKYFWQLSLTWMWNGFFWNIDSRTDNSWTIPQPWMWDLDSDISNWNDYKRLTFDRSLQYAFYKDISSAGSYYTQVADSNIKNIHLWSQNLDLSIRVPMKLYNNYNWWSTNLLDYPNPSSIDLDSDEIDNDIIVNRSLFGYTWNTQFTIFPTIDVDYWTTLPTINNTDTTIRESSINNYNSNTNNITFETTSIWDSNPNLWWSSPSEFNQSPVWAVDVWFFNVLNNSVWNTFASSKTNQDISKMHLKLSLVNYLKYTEDKVYPYLEVKLDAWKEIPKLDFNVTWRWKAWEYDVSIKMQKPVFETTAASDFTVLF